MNLTSGELYFINEIDVLTGAATPFHKIGLVKDLRQGDVGTRVNEHQTGNPRRLVVVDRVDSPAVKDLETSVHNRFARQRVLGEWFVLGPDELTEVTQSARVLAAEQTAHLPALRAAGELARVESNGSTRAPTPENLEWYVELRAAKELAKRADVLKERSVDLFKSAIARGLDVSLHAGWTEKTRSTVDGKKFAESYPDLFATFQKEQWSTPKLTHKKNCEFEIPGPAAEFIDLERRFSAVLDASSPEDFETEKVHLLHLELLGHLARANWDREIAEANLKAACGEHAGLEGLVRWNRAGKPNFVLDRGALKREHPEIWAEFGAVEAYRSFAVEPMRSYAIG